MLRALNRSEKLTLYRHIIKLAVNYPSKNRIQILGAIHDDFAAGRSLKDERISFCALECLLKRTRMLHAHLKMYDAKMQELHETGKIVKPYQDESVSNHPGDLY
mmetsp:Transcript_30019/g.53245  ORF Transcript_30019/g.53245 Transcript_30019/m.53245 type:complete len:104 (-) Transcript_30019:125-436(-)